MQALPRLPWPNLDPLHSIIQMCTRRFPAVGAWSMGGLWWWNRSIRTPQSLIRFRRRNAASVTSPLSEADLTFEVQTWRSSYRVLFSLLLQHQKNNHTVLHTFIKAGLTFFTGVQSGASWGFAPSENDTWWVGFHFPLLCKAPVIGLCVHHGFSDAQQPPNQIVCP